MAGTAGATAGGWLAPDWDGPIMRIPTDITITASPTPVRPGITAPIRQAITHT